MLTILFALASAVSAFTDQQRAITRAVFTTCQAPPWSAAINSVLSDQFAFTDVAQKRVYIDCAKFKDAPHSFANVQTHECGHLRGGQHQDGSMGMQYSLLVDSNGVVVDDSTLLLPLPAQLFSGH